ncbi:hypothetical protein OHC33_002911 [Knufia fluminis]|uniref:Nuclear pore complex protein Nup133 n=1 Tax=Knufia fluminis TaxID=191047 RepID=A0AAN8EL82_9EURO|nr:hypothetical protein OHC33_002911 [Knufia fluminis]
MSSTDTPSNSRLLRSKRNRTSGTDDSVKLPATKKRRSALRRDTFEPLTASSLNEIAGRTQPDAKTNGAAAEPAQRPPRSTSQSRELTLRGGKKTEKRSERGSGLLTLSTNDFYTVLQLPALPEQIRAQPTVSYSCVISPENDYILAVTHTDALVWSYNASASTPTSRELLNFKLPFPPAAIEDPLPLAAFTSRTANGEPGIVVVSPKWGKIVYWETLSSATSYAPTQSANGVHGSIPGMQHGDYVKELVPAEPAGFILAFKKGRVAQLTIRDQVGRPGVGVQFMSKQTMGSAKGGIFGSIRNVFGGHQRNGAAIVRPGKVARAQRDIAVCTHDGEFEFWTNNLLTGNHLSRTLSIKDQILAGLETQIEQADLQHPIQFKVIDFCLATTPSSHELIRRDDTDSSSITMLVALSSQAKSIYYLVETTIAGDAAYVRVVHPVKCYTDDVAEDHDFRPRVCIPPFSATAFIAFEKAVVVMSVAKISESPSSQLMGEKSTLPIPFQDCIRLQDNTIYRTINVAVEQNETGPGCVLAIQGFGIMRVVSHLANDQEIEIEDVVTQLSAKTRIEQAIFFGTKHANPLDLRRPYREAYSLHEIYEAVGDISKEILESKSQHISKSSPSTADHLQQRIKAMQDLVEYVLRTYPACLDRSLRLTLLSNAEKVAAAQAIWKAQEKILTTYPRKDDREFSWLEFALRALSEKYQKYPDPEKGETDHVRFWLIHSLFGIHHLLKELADSMGELEEMHLNDPRIICDYFVEGIDIWSAALQSAFKFRENNASLYGLGNEAFKDGVLLSGYPVTIESLAPWTSGLELLQHGQGYVRAVTAYLGEWWDYSSIQQNGTGNHKAKNHKAMPTNMEGEPYDAPSRASLVDLADRLPRVVELLNRMTTESNIQHKVHVGTSDQSQEEKKRSFKALDAEARTVIREDVRQISPYNRDGSIGLAEAQKDSTLLVELNLAYLADLSRELKLHPKDERAIKQRIRAVQDHVETYFERFGNEWAYAHFSSMIERGELGRLIGEGQADGGKKQPYITWFFENCSEHNKRLGKIAWINSVVGENKYDAACRTLETVAETQEADIWSKKTEFCLAKLAGLAALETGSSAINETKIDHFDFELEYLRIIESVAAYINASLFDAVDDEAAVQLAVDLYIPKSIMTNKKSAQLRKHLSQTLYKLVTNQTITLAELVDALTLLQLEPLDANLDVDDISDEIFPLALQAIDLASSRDNGTQQKDILRKTVWRRLLIKDDWLKLNQTSGKSDDQVKQEMQRSILFETLLDLIRRAEDDRIDIHIPSVEKVMGISASQEDRVPEEVKVEHATLKKYVDKARLAEHFDGLVKEAKDELRRFRDQEGQAVADEVLASGEVNGDTNGHVNGDHS